MTNEFAISFDDAVEFMHTFGQTAPLCPFCKSSSWTISADMESDDPGNSTKRNLTLFVPFGTSGGPPSILTQGGVAVMTLECRECGYMHLFSKEKMADRIKRHREAQKNGSDGNSQ